jgi:glycosyltransferase involved in cell wall biosynthesis
VSKRIQKVLFVYPEPYFASGGGIATYLQYAIRAQLDAGRDIHLLTWTTPADPLYYRTVQDDELAPLRRDQVTILRFAENDIQNLNPVGVRGKNLSDLLFPHIAALEARFRPDLIEGSDYLFPLHSYLERRRCGLHSSRVPVATFNHGLLNDIYPASALFPSEAALRELAFETQVVRWADIVLAPSEAAAARIKELRRTGSGVHVLREPFVADRWNRRESFDPSQFLYFGRVSFAKGADVFAGMLTAISGYWPISDITFLGRRETMPFRRADATEFLHARLHPDLRDKTHFLDAVPREEVGKLISCFSFFGNFSRSETFSYTTLEALAQGVVPLLLRDSPMAELLPPDIRDRGTFNEVPHRTEAIREVLSYWTGNYAKLMERCQSYAAELTAPERYAEAYEHLVSYGAADLPGRPRFTGQDVTILISTHNDAHLLREALVSVLSQTVKVNEILVLDDGTTNEAHLARLDALAADGTVRLIRVRNMGLVAGRNVLVESARTKLVVFLDADDRLAPSYVEKTLNALNSDPDRWSAVLTRRKNFGMNDHEASSFLLDTPMHWILNDFRMTALIKRRVLEEIRFDPGIRNGEADDWWWWLNFTLCGHEATFVPEPLFHYRAMPGSMSLPWSQGQAALTIELLKRAATAAVNRQSDVLPALQLALFAAYKHGWDADALRAQLPSASDQRIEVIGRAAEPLIRIVGRERAGALIAIARRVVRGHPLVHSLARAALHRIRTIS